MAARAEGLRSREHPPGHSWLKRVTRAYAVGVRFACLACLACACPSSGWAALHTGFPLEWRLFETRSVLRDSATIAARSRVRFVAIEGGLSRLSEARAFGHGSPDVRFGHAGPRGAVELNHGLWHVGLEAIDDAAWILREEEFPAAAYADRSFPTLRTTVRAAGGFGSRGGEGEEWTLELDGPSFDTHAPRADFRPSLVGWVRVHHLRSQSHASVTPAISVAVLHVPILASGLPLAITASTELEDNHLPRTRCLSQLGWQAGFHSFGGEDAPVQASWAPWIAIGYGVPLDNRSTARFALTAGLVATLVRG